MIPAIPVGLNGKNRSGVRSGRRPWITLGILWFVYVLNFLDRQLLSDSRLRGNDPAGNDGSGVAGPRKDAYESGAPPGPCVPL